MPKAVKALAMASHPGPALVVTAVAVLLGVGIGSPPPMLALLGGALLSDQLSVGWCNDAVDAPRDRAVARRDKPVAQGLISRRTVAVAALSAFAVALLLTVPLGAAALITHAVALLSAWSYNLWLKRTPASVIPYMVSFGLLPAIVTLANPEPRWPAWWATVAGCLFGAAAHFTNVLPDLEEDSATGVRGLGHLLGPRVGGLVSFALLGLAAVVIGWGAVGDGLQGWPAYVVIIAAAVTISVAAFGTLLTVRGVRTRLLMRLIMGSAVLEVIALVAAGSVLSGPSL
ncbi:UbiA family prenyltransferase [Humibacter ginsenosidimutans]|uniref:1,4-dihydroxy-2-naphthoate prenyltransferase n=1 Tax=Humibacter ginsenosidimutans TaxID=2599293 RepID=A0A5B8M207_9MICO|nr:UbiA family prenyltransferase [Humibacter ginsenosidimutans]QDZ13984.1 1,4-dihydroxy-2-naphthoate prenyltransferase [Humibacter ginsenosidimutans]